MIYILRRVAFYLAAFFVAVTLNFFIPRVMPGDPSARIIASFQGRLNEAQVEAIRASYGATGSLWEQYVGYVLQVLRFDFGISTVQFPEPTSSLLFYGATWTLVLVGIAITFAFLIGTMMGIHAAWNRGEGGGRYHHPAAFGIDGGDEVTVAAAVNRSRKRQRRQRDRGGDVNDGARAPLAHLRQHGLGHCDRAQRVRFELRRRRAGSIEVFEKLIDAGNEDILLVIEIAIENAHGLARLGANVGDAGILIMITAEDDTSLIDQLLARHLRLAAGSGVHSGCLWQMLVLTS